MLSREQLCELLIIAKSAAAKAAAVINRSIEMRLNAVATGSKIGRKINTKSIKSKSSSTDLVTKYDKRAEKVVMESLHSDCSEWLLSGDRRLSDGTKIEFAMLSEESHTDDDLTDKPTWVIDPIDGTTAFVHCSFDLCVSIGLSLGKFPVLGVVNCPRLKEVFWGYLGGGAFCNGRKIHVSNCTDMSKALISTRIAYNRSFASVDSIANMNHDFAAIYKVHGIRCYGSCAMDMCSVACGRLDMYLEAYVHAWDMCAAAIIVREAGGIVSSIDKEDYDWDNKKDLPVQFDLRARNHCTACTPEIMREGIKTAVKHKYKEAVFIYDKKSPSSHL